MARTCGPLGLAVTAADRAMLLSSPEAGPAGLQEAIAAWEAVPAGPAAPGTASGVTLESFVDDLARLTALAGLTQAASTPRVKLAGADHEGKEGPLDPVAWGDRMATVMNRVYPPSEGPGSLPLASHLSLLASAYAARVGASGNAEDFMIAEGLFAKVLTILKPAGLLRKPSWLAYEVLTGQSTLLSRVEKRKAEADRIALTRGDKNALDGKLESLVRLDRQGLAKNWF
jgi:hypothetical protein